MLALEAGDAPPDAADEYGKSLQGRVCISSKPGLTYVLYVRTGSFGTGTLASHASARMSENTSHAVGSPQCHCAEEMAPFTAFVDGGTA